MDDTEHITHGWEMGVLGSRLAKLGFADYQLYLKSDHWICFRRRIATVKSRCRGCHVKAGRRLDVHHITYERLGAEIDSDVICLCRDCHAKVHAALDAKYPWMLLEDKSPLTPGVLLEATGTALTATKPAAKKRARKATNKLSRNEVLKFLLMEDKQAIAQMPKMKAAIANGAPFSNKLRSRITKLERQRLKAGKLLEPAAPNTKDLRPLRETTEDRQKRHAASRRSHLGPATLHPKRDYVKI